MRRNTRDVLGAGLVGYLVGKRRLHPIRAALWLVLVWLCVAALGIALLAYYWRLVVLVLAVGAVVVFVRHRRRRQQPTWPTSPPPWGSARQAPSRTGPAQRQLPPSQDALDAAYAAGYNRGQREARTVERTWGRSVPAADPDDPDSF